MTADSISRANKWRSGTVNILKTTNKFRQIRETQLTELLKQLSEDLTPLLISIAPDMRHTRLEALEVDIVKSAFQLKETMASSTAEYKMVEPKVSPHRGVPGGYERRQWTCRDVATWRDTDMADSLGGVFFCLSPSLCKKGVGRTDTLELIKPVVVVYDQEATRQIREFRRTSDTARKSQASQQKVGLGNSRPPPDRSKSFVEPGGDTLHHNSRVGARKNRMPIGNSTRAFSFDPEKMSSRRRPEEESGQSALSKDKKRRAENSARKDLAQQRVSWGPKSVMPGDRGLQPISRSAQDERSHRHHWGSDVNFVRETSLAEDFLKSGHLMEHRQSRRARGSGGKGLEDQVLEISSSSTFLSGDVVDKPEATFRNVDGVLTSTIPRKLG